MNRVNTKYNNYLYNIVISVYIKNVGFSSIINSKNNIIVNITKKKKKNCLLLVHNIKIRLLYQLTKIKIK